MRDRYYDVRTAKDAPERGLLVRLYRRNGHVLAQIENDEDEMEAEPDLIFLRAALCRLREDRVGIFVLLEDGACWHAPWGDLVTYRGSRQNEKPTPLGTPALVSKPNLLDAWDYTLNLNSMTSPSLTT